MILRLYVRIDKGEIQEIKRRLSSGRKKDRGWHRYEIDFINMQLKEIEIK